MGIQNLRVQLLSLSNGDIEKAKAMESYVLNDYEPTETEVGEAPKAVKPRADECKCLICLVEKAIKEQGIKS